MRNHSYENDFDLYENETACRTHFHMEGFAIRLVLKQRHKKTRKWPFSWCFCAFVATPAFPMGSFHFPCVPLWVPYKCHLLNRTPSIFPRVSGGSLTMLPMSLIWAILCIYWSVTPRIPCVYNYPRASPRSFAIAFSAHLVSVPLRSCLAL